MKRKQQSIHGLTPNVLMAMLPIPSQISLLSPIYMLHSPAYLPSDPTFVLVVSPCIPVYNLLFSL